MIANQLGPAHGESSTCRRSLKEPSKELDHNWLKSWPEKQCLCKIGQELTALKQEHYAGES
ncbi:MAG: hypothetical protein WBA63_10905 [Thermomicrobiales bacterium]